MAGKLKKNRRVFKKGLRKAFTLIELLISMVIFVIFLGIVSTSYVSIVRAQRDANQVRKVYSEIRSFVDDLTEDIRLSEIDYNCFNKGKNLVSGVFLPCESSIIKQIAVGEYLALLKKDGLEAILYRYDADKKTVFVKKWQKRGANNWVLEQGAGSSTNDEIALFDDNVEITDFRFLISPLVNPYDADNYANNAVQFQPKVTILMTAGSAKSSNQEFSFDFQTTISSRVYSR